MNNLPGFIHTVAPIVNHYGYFAVFGFILLEDFGLFFVPGETILIAAAIFAGLGELNIFAVIIVAFLGALIGDNIGYLIGLFGGRALIKRWGKYIFLTEKKLHKVEHLYNKHGGLVVAGARFVDVLRQANGIIAGVSKMPWKKFLKFNALGAILWVGFWSSAGYFGGSHVRVLLRYQLYVSIIIISLLIFYIIYSVVKRIKPNK